MRSGGLVDYDDDDEDDEDYRPPPKMQKEREEDEGSMESLRLKRKLPSKDKDPEVVKKQRLVKNPKSSVFAALCTTLSQAVLPNKKAASVINASHATDDSKSSAEKNHDDKEPPISRSSNCVEENHKETESAASRSCSDCKHSTSETRQLSGEDSPLIPPNSSPEMAVNGS